MQKRLLSGVLAAAMLVSPVYAIDTAGGAGDVPVHLTQEVTRFSVTVPTVLPVDVNAKGIVTVANDNKIINNSYGPVEVKSVSIQSQGDWTLVDFNTDFKSKKVGLHEYGFQMNNVNVQPDGSCAAEFEVIPGNSNIRFDYDSNVAVQNIALDRETIANVVFTVGWSGGETTPDQPEQIIPKKLSKEKMDGALIALTGKITFTKTAYQGEGGIDISEAGNRSVIAVVDGQDATVYADGGVLGIDTFRYIGMFQYYEAREIDFYGIDMSKMTDASNMFFQCGNLRKVDLSGFDISNATSIDSMFSHCMSLETVDLSNVNMSNAENAVFMFCDCHSLLNTNFSGMNMNNVKEVSKMFESCKLLTSIDFSNVKMNNLVSTNGMFTLCLALETIDLSGISMKNLVDGNHTFQGCHALETVYLKTQEDCDKFKSFTNDSGFLPFENYVVKPTS